jgi:hypothetical protein
MTECFEDDNDLESDDALPPPDISEMKTLRVGPTPAMLTFEPRGSCLDEGPDRCCAILRELVRSLRAGELSDELILRVDTIAEAFIRQPPLEETDVADLVKMTQGCNMHPEVRESVISLLQREIHFIERYHGKIEGIIAEACGE